MAKAKGPRFLRFAIPILQTLKTLGGSGKRGEVIDAVIEALAIPEQELEEMLKSGVSRVRKEIVWARFYFAKGGYIDPSERGLWRLTKQGEDAELTETDVHEMFKNGNYSGTLLI